MAALHGACDMKILFVCEGNMMRSQIAEAFYNSLTGTRDTISAGTYAYGADCASRRAVRVMDEIGLSLDGHYSKQLTDKIAERVDKIILFSVPKIPAYLQLGHAVEDWNVHDLGFGTTDTLELDRQVRDDIRRRVKKLVKELHDEN